MNKTPRQSGFTIIELMIATVVFTIVLLVISGAIIQIGRLYYKGITAARTQTAARQVTDSITQAVQFNAGQVTTSLPVSPDGKSNAVCIGSQYFMYTLGQQKVDGRNSLITRNVSGGCGGLQAQNMGGPVAGTELLGDKMRLSNLSVVQQSANTYRVTVRIVYGDDDLLCIDGGSGGAACNSTDTMLPPAIDSARNLRCKDIRSGTQFCALSELSTIVERRIN